MDCYAEQEVTYRSLIDDIQRGRDNSRKLVEELIRFVDNNIVGYNWDYISVFENIPEDYIRDLEFFLDWRLISKYQKLSLNFIREFSHKVNWVAISKYQKLSTDFIREFADYVEWSYICKYQELSEDFINEFQDKVCWSNIAKYQMFTLNFMFNFTILEKPENNWLRADNETKREAISPYYEIVEEGGSEYVLAYKAVRKNGYSLFNFQYKYEEGQTYYAHCDCNLDEADSFGLSAWIREGADMYGQQYGDEYKIIEVKIKLEDVGAFIVKSKKLRCFTLTVIGEG